MIKSFKKTVFFGLALVCPLVNTPTIAMEIETDAQKNLKTKLMNIGDITPLKDGMTYEDAKSAIQSFFQKEVFVQQNEITWKDIYRVKSTSSSAGRSYTLITLEDGSEWVPNVPVEQNGTQYEVVRHGVDKPDGIQRFLGALYLKKAINNHSLSEKWGAVDTKFLLINPNNPINLNVKKSETTTLKNIFTIDSQDFISLSRYAGENKRIFLSPEKLAELTNELKELTSYCDFIGGVNLRKETYLNDRITIIDTAYNSFCNFYTVKSPSAETQNAIGGKTFTFSKADLMGQNH